MSMPSFPPNGAGMTREEALTMIIASIAMEELALSHILNAEGEKLQYILETLLGTNPHNWPQNVQTVNKSVAALVEVVTQNQMLLKSRLSQVLEFCPLPPAAPPPRQPEPCPPPPCPPPPCPPPPCRAQACGSSALQLTGRQEAARWNPGCRMTWRKRSRAGKAIRWNECAPAQIYLTPGKTYKVQYTLNVRAAAPAEGAGTILLKQSHCGMFTDALPLCFSMEDLTDRPQSLHMLSVLHPRSHCGCETCLFLVLDAPDALCVEGAVLDVAELP